MRSGASRRFGRIALIPYPLQLGVILVFAPSVHPDREQKREFTQTIDMSSWNGNDDDIPIAFSNQSSTRG